MSLIAIGLGTHKRPKMLAQTLASLCALEIPEGCKVHLLLVDNAPEEPAEPVFNEYKNRFPFKASYFQEPRKGLCFMRNRVLEEAKAIGADFLAFLDDDETARPDWLVQHYKTHQQYHADVVSGRTLRILPQNTPEWIVQGRFFEKGNRPTGIPRPTSSTCNVFFDFKKLCLDWNLRFDPRLNFTVGEDILFFRQAHERGARIIWCNECIVEEVIPESRTTQTWLIERAFAIGMSTAYRNKKIFPAYQAYPRTLGFMIGEYITAFSFFFKSNNGMPLINETRRKHHIQLAKGLYNGLFKMKGGEVYKQQHGF